MIGHDSLDAERLALLLDQGNFGVGIGRETVDRDHRGQAELLHVLDVAAQIAEACVQRRKVFLLEIFLFDAAMHLERPDGGDDDDAGRLQTRLAALDVDELLRAEIGTEARFRDDIVGELERRGGGNDRIAAMGDVGERTAMDEGRRAFQRLHQVRRNRLLQKRRHGAVCLDVPAADRLAVAGIGDDDIAEPFPQIIEVLGETKDRHDFGRDRDVEARLARIAVGGATERADDLAQGTVVHIDTRRQATRRLSMPSGLPQ